MSRVQPWSSRINKTSRQAHSTTMYSTQGRYQTDRHPRISLILVCRSVRLKTNSLSIAPYQPMGSALYIKYRTSLIHKSYTTITAITIQTLRSNLTLSALSTPKSPPSTPIHYTTQQDTSEPIQAMARSEATVS